MTMSPRRYHLGLLMVVVAVFIWSSIQPHDRMTWAMEVAPVVIGLALLLPTNRRFTLTPLLYGLIAFHCVILMIGGKYTYAEVPLFNWLRDTFDLTRNHYDRVGHFVQGFVPAILARELLLRTSPLRPGKWLFSIVVCGCLAFSAFYELIEWQAAVALGSGADAFLATQGDPWDTQKDMALALLGSVLAQLALARVHDRQLLADRYLL
jgi:putative membrane protein